MTLSLANICEIIDASLVADHSKVIDNISIDSRSLLNNTHTLFFAIQGPNRDGHDFISDLLSQGVRYFVVSTMPKNTQNGVFLVVPDTLEALQKLAKWHRSQFSFPVIGITGSNGKTIVKEWLNFLLAPEHHIIKSPKSYNSQVGVPLSVLGINEQHNLGIFEAGISLPGEMEKLAAIVAPTIGVLTNIGSAHDEGFSSRANKRAEKAKLFERSQMVICEKSEELASPCFTWSFSNKADVEIDCKKYAIHSEFEVHTESASFTVKVPFTDDASLNNVATCIAVMRYLKYNPSIIAARVENLFPVQMRLQIKNGVHGTILIDDSYSSDFQSLKIALDFMESQSQPRKTLIISDILQSGLPEDLLYKEIARMVTDSRIATVIGIGQTISKYSALFPQSQMFPSTDAFLDKVNALRFENETILIKGARSFKFERIVHALEQKTHETVFEINLNAISHNLNFYKAKLNPTTKIMVMIKAFGYGSGGFELARLLEYHKVDYLGVAFADEGITLKLAGIKLPIMVLNPENTSFDAILQYGLEPEIYSLKGLLAFINAAKERKVLHYPIHIKLDTGMHRLGFQAEDIEELTTLLQQTHAVQVKSILSHMAASDDETLREFSLNQISVFNQLSKKISAQLSAQPIRHILNTSGITHFSEAQFDMVRLGIGLYGISNQSDEQQFLQQVGTLKSVISQLRLISAGDSVGYGRRYIATNETLVATIPIGYADGIRRSWGNEVGYVLIAGKRAPIIGSICMDMLMVNCTGIACNEGDQVIILGEDPSVLTMAKAVGTIPYEILTAISQRVKRIFYRE